jgi:hypothetical protein
MLKSITPLGWLGILILFNTTLIEAVSRSQKPSIMRRAAGLARLVGP